MSSVYLLIVPETFLAVDVLCVCETSKKERLLQLFECPCAVVDLLLQDGHSLQYLSFGHDRSLLNRRGMLLGLNSGDIDASVKNRKVDIGCHAACLPSLVVQPQRREVLTFVALSSQQDFLA